MSEKPAGNCWYDAKHPEWLSSICDMFYNLQTNKESWGPVKDALYWYIRSNSANGVDGSLILSQCALELLSWHVIVQRSKALSEAGYSLLTDAAERLRLALALLGIPYGIPRALPKLKALAKAENWTDLPKAIVLARNRLVHPTKPRSGRRHENLEIPWHETWTAAQWIVELMILRILGYSGDYHNRTLYREFSRVESVPWS